VYSRIARSSPRRRGDDLHTIASDRFCQISCTRSANVDMLGRENDDALEGTFV
jgi:hypothetical protein